ncbi:unnamed protein product [Ectocarpus sp. CCAP 1310/34]|nr:unnamed protein product [Ectocarpus sp. CCAP 1310/34]
MARVQVVLKWGPHRCLQDKTPCPLVLNNQLCTILACQVSFILTTDNGNLSTAEDCVLEIVVVHVGQKASPPTEKSVGGAIRRDSRHRRVLTIVPPRGKPGTPVPPS